MTAQPKILFLDLDGTLLNDAKEITEGNRLAILEALKLGHKIVISTGRATSCAVELAESLRLTMEGCYVIAFNGACIYDVYRKEPVYNKTIPLPYVRYLLDTAHRLGIHAHTYLGHQVISETDTPDLHRYVKATHMTFQIVPDACKLLTEEPNKILVVDYKNHLPLEEFQNAVADWAKGKVDTYFSCNELLEVVAPGVTKGNAVGILCKHLGIPPEATIAAGDADNDITMLKAAHLGVVMKNAADYMYQYGDYITEQDNNHDGIAEVIQKFML